MITFKIPAAEPKRKKTIINIGLVPNQLSKINPIITPTTTAATSSVPSLNAFPRKTPFFSLSSIFLTNPSPICVLDEVDAPLDDANVTRFCSLLEELTSITKTKFIIITHHALTMSKMNRLYGVTMPEKGISKLVAVNLERAEELVA